MLEVESNSVLAATIALIAFIGVMHPDFLSWGQLKEVVQNSVYDRSKHEGEQAAFAAAHRTGVELVAICPSSVQGPGR